MDTNGNSASQLDLLKRARAKVCEMEGLRGEIGAKKEEISQERSRATQYVSYDSKSENLGSNLQEQFRKANSHAWIRMENILCKAFLILAIALALLSFVQAFGNYDQLISGTFIVDGETEESGALNVFRVISLIIHAVVTGLLCYFGYKIMDD